VILESNEITPRHYVAGFAVLLYSVSGLLTYFRKKKRIVYRNTRSGWWHNSRKFGTKRTNRYISDSLRHSSNACSGNGTLYFSGREIAFSLL
jgi:hypothetical protein